MFIIFLSLIIILGFILYRKKIKNSRGRSGRTLSIVDSYNQDHKPDQEIIENKNLLSTLAAHEYAERYLKQIDFDKQKVVNMNSLRLKAVRAGIRDNREHRVLAIGMVVLSIIFAVIGSLLPNVIFSEAQTLGVHILFSVGCGALGYFFPVIRLDSISEERKNEFVIHFPDMLDLMIVCVEAGMGPEQAFVKIAEEFHENAPVLSEEISILSAELTYFLDSTVAYENLQRRVDYSNIRAFCSALIQAKRFGTPLAKITQSTF